jgi:hypothetical protein
MSKFYVFAYDYHEELGGINDLIASYDTFDEAELSLLTMDTSSAPYGYFEGAHIATVDESGNLHIVRVYAYTHYYLDSDGTRTYDPDNVDNRYWKTYPEYKRVKPKNDNVSVVEGGTTRFDTKETT